MRGFIQKAGGTQCHAAADAARMGPCSGLYATPRRTLQAKHWKAGEADASEREADRMALLVVRNARDAWTLRPPAVGPPGAIPNQVGPLPPSVRLALASTGRALDPALQQDMEQRFGYSFARVRVHHGSIAAQSARDVGASAYTVGSQIVFGDGQFAPQTLQGRHLLAHELTHVVQQSAAPVAGVQARTPATEAVLQRTPDETLTPPAPISSDPAPTIGNLPRDRALSSDRFRLEFVDGKWREVHGAESRRRGQTFTAKGRYNFVLQDGVLWAVKHTRNMARMAAHGRLPGHTEAAQGERVTWAGEVRFSKSGQVEEWNDGSGHYRAAASTRAPVVEAGFPADKFQQHPEVAAAREAARQGKKAGPQAQLPVYQPQTRPKDSSPARIKSGPPRLDALEADLRKTRPVAPPVSEGKAPSVQTPTPEPTTPGVKTGAVPGVNVSLPKFDARGFGKAAIRSGLMLVAGWLLGHYATKYTEKLLHDQVKRLEPEIQKQVEQQARQVLATGWARFNPRPPMSVFVRLDISRMGSYEGELYDYFWSLPTVSVTSVLALPTAFAQAFPEFYGSGVSGPYFDRVGIGVLDEHHYYTYAVPLEGLISPQKTGAVEH